MEPRYCDRCDELIAPSFIENFPNAIICATCVKKTLDSIR